MRHLFAFLALLSGLTAFGASAQANVASASAMAVSVSATTQSDKRKQAECRVERKKSANQGAAEKGCKDTSTVIIFIPTVQFGPDRAYE